MSKHNWQKFLLLGIISFTIGQTKTAIATPSPLQLVQLPNPIPPNQPQLPPLAPPIPQPSPLQPTPLPVPGMGDPRIEIPGTIRVERFEFEGNTAFSAEELAEVTKDFVGKEITFGELLQAEAAVIQKYVEAGYLNSGAVIAANQNFPRNAAIIKIIIVEGGVEEIEIIGTERLNSNYVSSRLELATKAPFNSQKLLEALQLLQLDPLIDNISAELQAGSRPEKSRLQVRVREASTFSFNVFADNNRSPSVGSFRRGVSFREGNLLGLGDTAELSYANTDGSNEFNGSYTLPINAKNGTIRVAAGLSRTEVIEPPFDVLNIVGKSRSYELTYRQPVILTPSEEFALGLTFSRQETETTLDGEGFPLSLGANDQGETRASVFRFFQEYVNRQKLQVFAARSQFSIGTKLFDATQNNDAPDSRFFAWRGQAQYVRQLAPETLLIVRSDLQLSKSPLLSLEQIGLGGGTSVRGYRQDLLLNDNGFLASVEARIPILRIREAKSLVQISPFIDFGIGWNHSSQTENESNQLLGVGVGLLWQIEQRLNARLDWGIPLIKADSSDRTWQEQGIYFNINYFPF
ncbi:MAG TPA: ShlB/FhaC/HecB family hemolysin secretion/activation protein [Halomicronema sp.]